MAARPGSAGNRGAIPAAGHVNEILAAALAFCEAGCSVVPAMADGSKSPAGKWQRWQSERPDAAQVAGWLSDGRYDGFGVVCGAVSGGLEMLEMEGRAVRGGLTARYRDALADHELGDLWRRVVTGYAETTPGGGLHVLYRVAGTVRGNTKLARTAAAEVLIETRGEGGFVVVAPSGGSTHPSGKPWQLAKGGPGSIATISEQERDALHAVASILDQSPVRQVQLPRTAAGAQDSGRPGDDYTDRAGWQDILAPHGWRPVRKLGDGAIGWCRPGKDGPFISATTRETGGLYVFSTSTPFEDQEPYSKFGAYAVLNHGGDHAAAAAQLRRDGYGAPREHDDDGIRELIASGTAAASSPGIASGAQVVRLADVEPEHVSWLWDGYLPLGKLVILDGDPGVGKSTVSLDSPPGSPPARRCQTAPRRSRAPCWSCPLKTASPTPSGRASTPPEPTRPRSSPSPRSPSRTAASTPGRSASPATCRSSSRPSPSTVSSWSSWTC